MLIAVLAPTAPATAAVKPAKAVAAQSAQPVQAVVGTKNCQVIRSCNFSRRARVRGCLSSYSCRACSFVRRSGIYRLQCRWGGPPN